MAGEPRHDGLRVHFWGVRGSIPAAGAAFDKYGGHTPCIELRCGERLFIIDAGSGLTQLGVTLGTNAPGEIDILLSHLHLDHVIGLPFFKPAMLPDRCVRLHCGNLRGLTAEDALDRLFSPPLFPVTLSQLPGQVEHHGFKAGDDIVFPDGFRARSTPLNHPGGATGYRFDHAGRSFCYISDIEHSDPWPPPELAAFIEGADLMVYDGMFSETEYLRCRGWGHSTWQKGVALAQAAKVKQLAVFHLHPQHDDAYLDALEAEVRAAMPGAFLAREGQTVDLPPLP